MSQLYFDVTGPTSGGNKITEEYIVKLITRFAVSLCTAFWSIKELFDYINNRRTLRDLVAT